MMTGLGLVLLLEPKALNSPLTALALMAVAVAATVLLAWLAGRLTGGPQQGASRTTG
jgi:Kef-type K+ transport system membrane component KefB